MNTETESETIEVKLSQTKSVAVHKWPCDGKPRFAVAGCEGLPKVSYSVAYNIIFHESACELKPNGERIFTRAGIRRLKKLNASYLLQAGGWIRKAVRTQLGAAVLVSELSSPEPEHEKEPDPIRAETAALP